MEPNNITAIFRNAALQRNQVSQQNLELQGGVTTAWIINARPNAATLVFDDQYFTQLPSTAPYELAIPAGTVQQLDVAKGNVTVKYEVRFHPNPNENSFGHAGHKRGTSQSDKAHILGIGDDPTIVIG